MVKHIKTKFELKLGGRTECLKGKEESDEED
jgi:hypothetical protein